MSSEFLLSLLNDSKDDPEHGCPPNWFKDEHQNNNLATDHGIGDLENAFSRTCKTPLNKLTVCNNDETKTIAPSSQAPKVKELSPLAIYWILQYLPNFPEQNEKLEGIYDMTPMSPLAPEPEEEELFPTGPKVDYISSQDKNWGNYYYNAGMPKNYSEPPIQPPKKIDEDENSDDEISIIQMIFRSAQRFVSRRYHNPKMLRKLATRILLCKAFQALMIIGTMVGTQFLPNKIKRVYIMDPGIPIIALMVYMFIFFWVRAMSITGNVLLCCLLFLIQTISLAVTCSTLLIQTKSLLLIGIVFIVMVTYFAMVFESSCLKVDFIHSENAYAINFIIISVLCLPTVLALKFLTPFVFKIKNMIGEEDNFATSDLIANLFLPLITSCGCFILIQMSEFIQILRGCRIDLPLRFKKINPLRCALQLL